MGVSKINNVWVHFVFIKILFVILYSFTVFYLIKLFVHLHDRCLNNMVYIEVGTIFI